MKLVIRLQAFIRGTNARRKLAGLNKKSDEKNEKYFLSEERKETLKNVKWDFNVKIERRPNYSYKTGAFYDGTW